MSIGELHSLATLYEEDETAWLEQMAVLLVQRRFAELDADNLAEFLLDMSRRDKREVLSRLVVLMTHLLKWQHQPDRRTNSWRGTIHEQRRELQELLDSGTLRNYAQENLSRAYGLAKEQAAIEMDAKDETFSAECPWTIDELLSAEAI